jgi:hypothetical protein
VLACVPGAGGGSGTTFAARLFLFFWLEQIRMSQYLNVWDLQIQSIPGLSDRQMRTLELNLRCCPNPAWCDGLLSQIAAALPPGGPPWLDPEVDAAIKSAFTATGVDLPYSG